MGRIRRFQLLLKCLTASSDKQPYLHQELSRNFLSSLKEQRSFAFMIVQLRLYLLQIFGLLEHHALIA